MIDRNIRHSEYKKKHLTS